MSNPPTIEFIQEEFNEGRAMLSYVGTLLAALEDEKRATARLSSWGFQELHLENEQLKARVLEADNEVETIDRDYWALVTKNTLAEMRVKGLADTIKWALGENGTFLRRCRTRIGKGKKVGMYWWRLELRKRLNDVMDKEVTG